MAWQYSMHANASENANSWGENIQAALEQKMAAV
jgi:hypothetical protein